MNVAGPYAAVESQRARLLKLARLLLRDDDGAQTAVEQTLRAARERTEGIHCEAALIGIFKERIADRLRQGEVTAAVRGSSGAAGAVDGLFTADGRRAMPVREWGDPRVALSSDEFMATLRSCIEELPPLLASAILLREWMQYDTGTLCRALGISETECSEQLFRARLLIGECLRRRWFEAGRGPGAASR